MNGLRSDRSYRLVRSDFQNNDDGLPYVKIIAEKSRESDVSQDLVFLNSKEEVGDKTKITKDEGQEEGDNVFSDSANSYCVRHLYQNFKLRFKGMELRDHFWVVASTGNIHNFKRAMVAFERDDPKQGNVLNAAEWLKRVPPH